MRAPANQVTLLQLLLGEKEEAEWAKRARGKNESKRPLGFLCIVLLSIESYKQQQQPHREEIHAKNAHRNFACMQI